jgi:sphinganine C4-monooxygenase
LEVLRDVIIQHIIQVAVGIGLGWMEPEQMTGKDDYNVAIWAQRIRIAQRALPQVLGVVGLNASAISKNVALSYPLLAGAISGGHYPWLTDIDLTTGSTVLAFANWELLLAKFVYWVAVPSMQFMIGIVVQDAWQYWIHRAMHLNKWLYSELVLAYVLRIHS